jgi:hypothetical protein
MGTYNPELCDRWEALSLEVPEKKEEVQDLAAMVQKGEQLLKELKSSQNKRLRRDEEEHCENHICHCLCSIFSHLSYRKTLNHLTKPGENYLTACYMQNCMQPYSIIQKLNKKTRSIPTKTLVIAS